MDITAYFEKASESEKPKKVVELSKDIDSEDVLDMFINQAVNGCCEPKMRVEAFKRAVCMIVDQHLGNSDDEESESGEDSEEDSDY